MATLMIKMIIYIYRRCARKARFLCDLIQVNDTHTGTFLSLIKLHTNRCILTVGKV